MDTIAASSMADGHVTSKGVFQLIQGINTKSGQHASYVLSFLCQCQPYLNQKCLEFSRSIALNAPHKGLNYSWRLRAQIDLKPYANAQWLLETESKSGRKNVHLHYGHYYFKNPGLTLARIYMQDGSLSGGMVPHLHIQTTDKENIIRLQFLLYQYTGSKWLSKQYDSTRQPYILTLCLSHINQFVGLIQPHMHPCFSYNINNRKKWIILYTPEKKI